MRAWTARIGVAAPEAVGVIRTDFERRFIRDEVIGFNAGATQSTMAEYPLIAMGSSMFGL